MAGLLLAAVLAAAPAEAETLRLLVLGDSLSAGYGLAQDEAFPAVLQRKLADAGHDVSVLNAGVSGDTTAGGKSRLGWSLAEDPDAAIVELGGNDGLRGLDPQETYRNLDAILAQLDQAGVPALLAGMRAPPNLGDEYGREFAAVYDRLAEAHDVVYYPFFLAGVAAEPALNQDDGIHPNAEGVEEIVRRILPAVETLLARARGRAEG